MSNSVKTLEVISCPKTVSDLWDDLQKDIDPSSIIMKMMPNSIHCFRFLGPFVTVRRLFIPYIVGKNVKKSKIIEIMNGNEDVVEESMKKIYSVAKPNSKEARDTDYFFRRKIIGNFGQICVMVNALYKHLPEIQGDDGCNLKVVPLSRQICTELATKGSNIKINGMKARNVVIRKQYPQQRPSLQTQGRILGYNLGPVNAPTTTMNVQDRIGELYSSPSMDQSPTNYPTYTVDITEESFITQKQIDYLMKRGLFDINKVIKDVNSMQYGNYIYKEISDYRMPKEFNDVIFDELGKPEENKHIEKAEEELAEIPRDAFENIDRLRGSINSLEIE